MIKWTTKRYIAIQSATLTDCKRGGPEVPSGGSGGMGATYPLRVGWRLLGHFAVLLTGIFTMESAVVEKPLAIEPAESIAGARPMLPLLVLLFIGSGCSALIYEIVWLQLLQLVIGSTGRSMGVLLGTFMGGMCLGSLLLPRLI